jgi:uncharacterized membrane protein
MRFYAYIIIWPTSMSMMFRTALWILILILEILLGWGMIIELVLETLPLDFLLDG